MSGNVSRTELYRRVWQTPISRLAPELGLSDNGLRKLCLRNDIPVPARGYWARIAAGHVIKPAELPRPGDDSSIALPSQREASPRATRREKASPATSALPTSPTSAAARAILVRETLADCDPLVRNTERFFSEAAAKIERYKKEESRRQPFDGPRLRMHPFQDRLNGRIAPAEPGCLRIVATLRNIDWILRFHDALIRALAVHGCTVKAQQWNRSHVVEVHGSGEWFYLSFAEEFETRVLLNPQHSLGKEKRYIAKDTYKLKLDLIRSRRVWAGDQVRLTEQLPMIAREIAGRLAAKAEVRRAEEAEEAERRAEEQKKEDERRLQLEIERMIAERKASRGAQVDRARATAKAHDEFLALRRLVSQVEARIEPGDEAVKEWLTLVRPALVDPIDRLLQEVRAEAALDEKPLWWPTTLASDECPD